MKFNPVLTLEKTLEADCYMLKSFLSREYDPERPMGNVAAFEVADVVRYWLIGLDKEVNQTIPRSLEWLNIAITQDEWHDRPHPNFHLQKLHAAKALALWLQSGDPALAVWEKTRLFNLSVLESAYQKKAKTEGLDDYLCYCIQAEQYEAGIIEFEKYHGTKTISLKKKLSPRDFGYALCLHHIKAQFDPDELFMAGRRMLQANLDDNWFGVGQFKRGAMWLKNVYWHRNRTLSPLETILKAYENMPDVVRPVVW